MQPFSLRPSHLFGAATIGALALTVLTWAPWSSQARGWAAPKTSNVAMNCAPNQQAVVRQHVVDGELNVSIECGGVPAVTNTGFDQRVLPADVAPVNVGYRSAVPARVQVSATPRTARAAGPAVTRRAARTHDWRKDALMVGGSAGAGAGIGGLVGGKKGALIGAAIGGGGAALLRAAQK
jgi:hypothetical protein